MTQRLAGQRRVLVTGASSGIGLAVATALARQGGSVVLVGRSRARLERVVAGFESPGNHRLVEADLTDDDQVTEISGAMVADRTPLDGLIHCAGIFESTPFDEMDPADLDHLWAVNARAPFRLTQALSPCLRDGAAIIFVTSVSAHVGMAGQGAYAMTKGAIEAFSRTLSVELAPRSIRVNTIAPGYVATPMNAAYRERSGAVEERARAVLAGRLGAPEEIAAAASFLVSDEASFINGTTVHVDGGYPVAEVQRAGTGRRAVNDLAGKKCP